MEALLTNHALTLTTIMNDEMLSAQERHTALLAAEEEYYKEKMNIAARAADTINEQLLTDLDNLIEDWRSKTEGKNKS